MRGKKKLITTIICENDKEEHKGFVKANIFTTLGVNEEEKKRVAHTTCCF